MGIFSEFLSIKPVFKIYEPRCIINMDETPVYIDMPHRRTIHPIGDKTVDMMTSGNEKTRSNFDCFSLWKGMARIRYFARLQKSSKMRGAL